MAEAAEHPRDPRIVQTRITYDIEIDGSVEIKELPFVVGVLADLSGKPEGPLPPLAQRKFAEVDRDNFGAFMRSTRPRLALVVPNKLTDDGLISVELRFDRVEDFEPDGVVWQIEPLRKLAEARSKLADLQVRTERQSELPDGILELMEHPELLFARELGISTQDEETAARTGQGDSHFVTAEMPRVISTFPGPRGPARTDTSEEKSRVDRPREQRQVSRQKLETLTEESKQRNRRNFQTFKTTLNARIAEIDRLLSQQLNEILHASEFQRLESTWRGLKHLVHQTKTNQLLKIRVCNVSKQELAEDFEDAPTLHESVFFKKAYEEEFGTFGGAPYAAFIGDYEFRNHPQDLGLLTRISQVAATAHAPFVAAASPQLFSAEFFAELDTSHRLSETFEAVVYAKWRSFRHSQESRYVGLVMPRVLMRLPYAPDGHPGEAFQFFEDVEGANQSKYVWGNAVYSFGICLTAAFTKYHWCAMLTGAEGGGLVQGLPIHRFKTDSGQAEVIGPTEIAISDPLEEKLSKLGFIPLILRKGSDQVAFFSMRSCHEATTSSLEPTEPDEEIANELPYVLATSRFAHYVKAIVRDKMGGFRSKEECEDYLNRWIAQYVISGDDGSMQANAQRPLQEARIEVKDVSARAKTFKADIFMKPHFQLDERTRLRRTVTELPKAKY